jgi:hypothetical protein
MALVLQEPLAGVDIEVCVFLGSNPNISHMVPQIFIAPFSFLIPFCTGKGICLSVQGNDTFIPLLLLPSLPKVKRRCYGSSHAGV